MRSNSKKPTREQLERQASRLLKRDIDATRDVMASITRAWKRRERQLRDETGSDLPSASIAACDLFEAYARWVSAVRRAPRETLEEMPSLLADFAAASIIFAKTYGTNVYLPMLESGGEALPPPKHDVERPALRLVKAPKARRKLGSNAEKKK